MLRVVQAPPSLPDLVAGLQGFAALSIRSGKEEVLSDTLLIDVSGTEETTSPGRSTRQSIKDREGSTKASRYGPYKRMRRPKLAGHRPSQRASQPGLLGTGACGVVLESATAFFKPIIWRVASAIGPKRRR